METIKAVKVTRVIFQKDGFYIVALNSGAIAKGFIPAFSADITGCGLNLEGEWVTDKRYGEQFQIHSAVLCGGLERFYLNKIVGLSDKITEKIISKFGDNVHDVILNDPEALLSIGGIGRARLGRIKENWIQFTHLRNLSLFLGEYDITPRMIEKIYNEFHDKAIGLIRENPYILTQVEGIGFKKADVIALAIGINEDSPFRICSCATYVLKQAAEMEGHIYLPLKELVIRINDELGGNVDELNIESAVCDNKPSIIVENYTVSLQSNRRNEFDIIKWAENANSEFTSNISENEIIKHVRAFEQQEKVSFSNEQLKAIKLAVNNRVAVISGYAGTGKTTVAKAIIYVFKELKLAVNECNMAGCAMSGVAARRFNAVTGIYAQTIHSLLGWSGKDFTVTTLDYSTVFLDEAGMVNSWLFASLVRRLGRNTRFIIIGDSAQLPPIGAGNVFSDIINRALLPSVSLEKIFRQSESSVITFFAGDIRKGRVPKGYDKDYEDWAVYKDEIDNFFEKKQKLSAADMKTEREALNNRLINKCGSIVEALKTQGVCDSLTSVQVITPQRVSTVGSDNLNPIIQDILNNPDEKNDEAKFLRSGRFYCIGDKVMHLKNKDMELDCSHDSGDELQATQARIFNGMIGSITDIDQENDRACVEMITGERVVYKFKDFGDLIDHAYVCTCHKLQGSEFDYVIIPLSYTNFRMLSAQWLYTAVTRAKKKVYLVIEEIAFHRAAKNMESAKRNTFLSEKTSVCEVA